MTGHQHIFNRRKRAIHAISCLMMMLIGSLSTAVSRAQDLHFSQWFNAPLMTNPANTGFIPDADYRLGVNYRNQWSTVMSLPYKTFSAWGDAQVFRDRIESGWLGLGGMILRDAAGSGSLTSTKAYASVAYHQMLGISHLLSFGINAGWSNKRINTTNLKFPDQFDGKFFDNKNIGTTALEGFSPNINYVDIQTGINYAFFPSNKIYLNGGVSAWHLNRPRESFFANDIAGYDNRIPVRYSAFVNGSIKLNESVIINPMAYASFQAGTAEIVGGGYLQYNLFGNGEKQLLLGAYTRLGDAVIPLVGFEMNSIRISFTYDATLSGVHSYNPRRGAYEFSLIRPGFYSFTNRENRQTLCPSFH